ncbi:transposase [Limosilactobacillus fermentum]|nr:transposase [Limosilactobacillus fermentum]
MAKTNVVDKYCSIAKAVKHKALTMLESNVSQKDVSKFVGVSPSTIGRLLDSDQALLREEHDVDQLMDLLFTKWDVPAPFQTVLKTLRKNSEGVYNATVLPYSNGRVEGINRMIKLIQRTAYGLLTLVISSPGSDCIKWELKQKKGGARCKHRPPPKMTHQQDLTKSR